MTEGDRTTIGTASRVTISIVLSAAGVLASLGGIAWWIGSAVLNELQEIRSQMARNALALENIKQDVDEAKAESFTSAMAAETALRLAINNPGMRVPDPRNPDRVIVVQSGSVFQPNIDGVTHR